jgi:hypothetical protein
MVWRKLALRQVPAYLISAIVQEAGQCGQIAGGASQTAG